MFCALFAALDYHFLVGCTKYLPISGNRIFVSINGKNRKRFWRICQSAVKEQGMFVQSIQNRRGVRDAKGAPPTGSKKPPVSVAVRPKCRKICAPSPKTTPPCWLDKAVFCSYNTKAIDAAKESDILFLSRHPLFAIKTGYPIW